MRRVISVSAHEQNLRQLPCVVSGRTEGNQNHHCHGGSMLALGPEFPNPGGGQRNNPFLQIRLHEEYHTGDRGIDRMGVSKWERRFGSQLEYLQEVNRQLPYCLWKQAKLWRDRPRRGGERCQRPSKILPR